jgi:hypothetical protein
LPEPEVSESDDSSLTHFVTLVEENRFSEAVASVYESWLSCVLNGESARAKKCIEVSARLPEAYRALFLDKVDTWKERNSPPEIIGRWLSDENYQSCDDGDDLGWASELFTPPRSPQTSEKRDLPKTPDKLG